MGLKGLLSDFYQRLVYGSDIQRLDREKETAVMMEIERVVRETDSSILSAGKFRKRMLPSVRSAMQYISRLIPQVPGPVDFDPRRWEYDPLLRAMFLNAEELTGILRSSEALRDFFERTQALQTFAMLVAERREKVFFGIEKNGEIVRRDVPQKAVFFEDFKVIAPATDLAETQKQVQHRALVALFSRALEKITDLQSWKQELEKQQDLLKFKVRYSETSELEPALEDTDAVDNQTLKAIQVLGEVNKKIEEIETELGTHADRLAPLEAVLLNPEQHLRLETISLKLSRLGIRLDPPSTEPANEFTLTEFEMGPDLKRSVVWVRVERASFWLIPQPKQKQLV